MCFLKFLFGKRHQEEDSKENSHDNQEDMDDLDFDEMNDVWDEEDF